jgi:hypothetical protein
MGASSVTRILRGELPGSWRCLENIVVETWLLKYRDSTHGTAVSVNRLVTAMGTCSGFV